MTGQAVALEEDYVVARAMLEEARRIVLTTHVQPDGDGIGSEVALARFLRRRGHDVTILNPHPTARRFRFLEPDPPIVAYEDGVAEAALGEADLLVVLDISVPGRLGRLASHVDRLTLDTLILDHHTGPSRIPGMDVRDVSAAATGEIVYRLLSGWDGEAITPEIATALYAAIAYDTGGFRYSNTGARTHRIAAELIERGADLATTHRWLFESVSLAHARLSARVLGTFHTSPGGRVAWGSLPVEVMEEMGAGSEDVDGIVEALRAVEGVQVALLFKEVHAGATKVSLRSTGDADVQAFAARFGGGGHVNAAGIYLEEPIGPVAERISRAAVAAFDPPEDA